jgi:hypothetical protein
MDWAIHEWIIHVCHRKGIARVFFNELAVFCSVSAIVCESHLEGTEEVKLTCEVLFNLFYALIL